MRFVAICFIMFFSSGVAFAQEEERPSSDAVARARALYHRGAEAYEAHQWVECAESFEQSFVLVFAPPLLYNIGRCYEEAASLSRSRVHYRRAIAALRRYVLESPEEDDLDEVRHTISRLQAEMDLIPSDLPPTSLQDPPVQTPPEVEVPDPPVEVQEDPVDLDPPVQEVTIPDVSLTEVPDLELEEPGFNWTWTTVGSIATGVAGITAIVLGSVARSEFDSLQQGCGSTTEGCNPADVSRLDSLTLATNLLFGLSGVLLAGTGVAFAIEFSDQNRGTPAPSAFGASFTRSF